MVGEHFHLPVLGNKADRQDTYCGLFHHQVATAYIAVVEPSQNRESPICGAPPNILSGYERAGMDVRQVYDVDTAGTFPCYWRKGIVGIADQDFHPGGTIENPITL